MITNKPSSAKCVGRLVLVFGEKTPLNGDCRDRDRHPDGQAWAWHLLSV